MSRPQGWPTREDFTLGTIELPPPDEGHVLVRNLFMSVDPCMRLRMNEDRRYAPPFQLGLPLEGAAIGEIVESRARGLLSGDIVISNFGWREYFVAHSEEVRRVDRRVKPVTAYLGVLGMTGFAAWIGLNLVHVTAGDWVYISAAAGAVGMVAGQLAKIRGAHVIGSAGSEQKVEILRHELGFDAAFNYRDGTVSDQLAALAPHGIDVYFDCVGGDHLEAALASLQTNGRIIACGAISTYNDCPPSAGPRNLPHIISKRLTIKGFVAHDSIDRMPEYIAEVRDLLAAGELQTRETIVEGIEQAPQAFLDMLRGKTIGKVIVKTVP